MRPNKGYPQKILEVFRKAPVGALLDRKAMLKYGREFDIPMPSDVFIHLKILMNEDRIEKVSPGVYKLK